MDYEEGGRVLWPQNPLKLYIVYCKKGFDKHNADLIADTLETLKDEKDVTLFLLGKPKVLDQVGKTFLERYKKKMYSLMIVYSVRGWNLYSYIRKDVAPLIRESNKKSEIIFIGDRKTFDTFLKYWKSILSKKSDLRNVKVGYKSAVGIDEHVEMQNQESLKKEKPGCYMMRFWYTFQKIFKNTNRKHKLPKGNKKTIFNSR